MIRRIGKAGLLFLLGFVAGCGKEGDDFVARIGDDGITADEFRHRYEMYLSQVGQRDNIMLRKEILNNMINEKLIMADLDSRGFDRQPQNMEQLEQIRLQAVLDRYARRISVDTITTTEQEFREEFRAYNSKASVRYLYARTEDGAWALKKKLDEGATFEELARTVFDDPGLANNGGYIESFGWGEMEPVFEQQAFSLPLGEVSDPFPMKIGYGIMRVESRIRQPLVSDYDYAKARPKLGQVILERRTRQAISHVSDQLAAEAAIRFDPDGVRLVLENWGSLSRLHPVEEPAGQDFSDHPLVTFSRESWNIGEFSAKVLRTSERQRKRVRNRADVEKMITGLIVRDELVRRAQDEKLDDDPDVDARIKIIYYQYKLNSWREIVVDSALAAGWDDALLRSEYEQHKEFQRFPPEVNVAEVLVRTKEEGTEIARQAREGRDFASLARKHSIRLWAAKRGGELGFGTGADFGILGDRFLQADPGSIIGPEFVDPYYGVFRILARNEGRERSFEEAKPMIIQGLDSRREHEAFVAAVRNLRSKTEGVGIDMDVLANIQVAHQAKGKSS